MQPPQAPQPPDAPDAGATLTDGRSFELLVQGVTDYAIYMIDPAGRIATWNSGAARIKGWTAPEVLGQHFSLFFGDDDRASGLPQRALQTAATEGRFEGEGWRVRKDGSSFRAHVVIDAIRAPGGELLGFAKVTRDVSERYAAQLALEQAQEALFQARKLESIGRLTGGIAHDINNQLTVIVNNLALIERVGADPRLGRMIASARRAADRGAKLTAQLLAYARRQPLRPQVRAVDALVGDFGDVLERASIVGPQLQFDLQAGAAAVSVDRQQFESALLNLVVNGADAMPGGGPLTIRTRVRQLSSPLPLSGGSLSPGDYVSVCVEDQGVGMSPEVMAQALEPFFTTKDVGKGTGLGLSQVFGFVAQSGGAMDIRSAPGQGTTVEMMLPLATAVPVPDAGPAPARRAPGDRGGTALVVEDDPDVLDVATSVMVSLGYRVLSASDAPAALQILRSDASIDVLFSDVVMPKGVSGIELARLARALRPGLKILLASGYPMQALDDADGRLQEFMFLDKPYGPEDVARRLGETDARAAPLADA